ncbi:MAG: EamA family transporter [Proteobacteria bacterium]|nr:EamA family transporter [Pseudomonadota bacterium]
MAYRYLGGMLALSAYGLVIWALSLGAMAPIAALRETSVIIAALIGALFLGEPFGRRRVLAATGVAIGVIMLTATAS